VNSQPHAAYQTYWLAWVSLLVITVAMVYSGRPFLLVTGMTAKAAIIGLWFMHLRYERLDLVLCVVVGIFATALVLFLLMVPDGRAM
jgi:cytochrome c oxidase subunit IV